MELQEERYGNGNNDINGGGIATVHTILLYSILHSMFLINNYVRYSIKLGINHSKIVRSSEGNLIGNVDAIDRWKFYIGLNGRWWKNKVQDTKAYCTGF